MKNTFRVPLAWMVAFGLLLALVSCSPAKENTAGEKKKIVVTYSVLGSLVKELVGDRMEVQVLIPNGLDVHEWSPSAKDVEALMNAGLVVENGLEMEQGLSRALSQARAGGRKIFTASETVTVRKVGQGEGIPSDDPDQKPGASDPHLWMDPSALAKVVIALSREIRKDFDIDLSTNANVLAGRLETLDRAIREKTAAIPQEKRRLVTGHESLGYFAQAYGFKLVGAIIPSLSTQAEVSASELSALKSLIRENQVKVIFTELGTPAKVAQALANEAGVKTVEIHTHLLPADGSYFTMMVELSAKITDGLK